jgi:hypothetical protein
MLRHVLCAASFALVAPALVAQQPAARPTQLTIYNDNFAVARTTVPLDLHPGVNDVVTSDVTSMLEPDSVVLRDPAGKHPLHVLEQNYDAGVVTQEWLLAKYEGKTIDFQVAPSQVAVGPVGNQTLPAQIVQGRIVRAGDQPLIEVNGHLQFQLPGLPLFPASTDGLLLKPTLRWKIDATRAEKLEAELAYITSGMGWQATYNVVLPDGAANASTELADLVGWVTITNNSGTDFPSTTIKLMAGDVAKVKALPVSGRMMGVAGGMAAAPFTVTQKAFDDYHLYDLHQTVALVNNESKQVQFLEAQNVTVERAYEFSPGQFVYPGSGSYHNIDRDWGRVEDAKVNVRETIHNTTENHLGMPLPAGRMRLYRRDTDGQLQFVGEDQIEHTPENQTLHLTSGNAFDLTGESKQTDFHVNNSGHTMDESFEVKLHNAKTEPVTIHVIEHMNRAQNWQITEKSAEYKKQDSATVDFPVQVPAKGDATLTYSVHYTW